jgi:ribose 5-phosphate isomerase B
MKIAIGSDHAGFAYKQKIKEFLARLGHTVLDLGTDSDAPVDYPVFIRPVALLVANGAAERGIVLGGSGNGEAMVANRIRAFAARSVGTLNRPDWLVNTTMPTCSLSVNE